MEFMIDPSVHMWFGLFMTVVAFYLFSSDRWPLEVSSVVLLASLMLFGQVFPLNDIVTNENMLSSTNLLMGFSNPSLIAVLALLVIGQALIQTAALTPVTRLFLRLKNKLAILGLVTIFLFVLVLSGFLNNTPLVIIAIPVLQALGARLKISSSRIMIPLSYIAILGGMTTLVGSSTNMLVSTALVDLGFSEFSFFEFTIPGAIMAASGLFYVAFIVPRMLPRRANLAQDLQKNDEEFIAELGITEDSNLVGQVLCEEGTTEKLPDVNVRMVQRQGALILPPFEDYTVRAKDILIVATTRKGLMDVLSSYPGFLLSDEEKSGTGELKQYFEEIHGDPTKVDDVSKPEGESAEGEVIPTGTKDDIHDPHVLSEVMIPPSSRFIDMSVGKVDFQSTLNCMVLGIQRRANVVRRRLHQMHLQAGDVLLVAGLQKDVYALRDNPDMIVLAGSREDVPVKKKAPHALAIFMLTIITAALGIFPITVASVTGATAMVIAGCLNVRQVMRAFDQKIFFLVGAALALGKMLEDTGGAMYIANQLLSLPIMDDPLMAASALFILVAIATNLLTNNACAILFTPIAISLASEVGVDPIIFAITVVFGANCSFASPIGYQTNLLVMGPGHYKFKDFVVAGVPLVLIMWAVYTALAKYYFGL
jgi:di/tricarboxylate transporter